MDKNDLSDLLNKKEPLHPELARYLYKEELLQGAVCLKHPLIFQLFYNEGMNAFLNECFRVKTEAIEESIKEREWSKYVFMHERACRWSAFEEISGEMSDQEYWSVFSSIWIDNENIWQHWDTIEALLLDREHRSEYLMDDDERAILSALPDDVLIYRGCGNNNQRGFSWTLETDIAEFFALRLRNEGLILTGRAKKQNIIAVLTGRDEHEVIIHPDDVTIVNRETRKREQ